MVMPEANDGWRRLRSVLDVGSSLAFIIAAGAIVWSIFRPEGPAPPARPSVPIPTEPVSFDGAATMGSAAAPVVILIFSDFECPFCAQFALETLPTLKTDYADTGRVQLAFRHLPLPNHARAERAAEAAECAAAQGRFWPMHDRLFQNPKALGEGDFTAHAGHVGLDASRFQTCMRGAARSRVELDRETAKQLRLGGTPVFLVGSRTPDERVRVIDIVSGARPVDDFRRVIDKLLLE